MGSTTSVLWFRRDLRLADNPALLAAAAADQVVPLFVLDPKLWRPAGKPRQAYLVRSLHALDADLGGNLLVRRGDPVREVISVARAAGATEVHIAADFGPYGTARDTAVAKALAEIGALLVRTGSSYAVSPGRLTTQSGTPYQVFTPFFRAWREHGWRPPAGTPRAVTWTAPLEDHGLYPEPALAGMTLPEAGERAAAQRWRRFRDQRLADYAELRDRPDLDGTSQLSAHLKYGEIHPRTLLADLAALRSHGAEIFRSELAWREFYADVLHHRPNSAREYYKPELARMPYATGKTAEERLRAWADGVTGYPIVDAGMRQLRSEGWMHNRVRMIVASFLVKDLHLEWTHGARHFLRWLRDGDLASNNHGWQWVAGSGTDASPYFRIFNPVGQGKRFDPAGDYVRRYVAELRGVAGAAVHEPWKLPDGPPAGYPAPIVDHAEERAEALRRYDAVKGASTR